MRGSNRAVIEYAEELRRAEQELEMAQIRVDTLRDHAAGPPSPAGCCYRWTWDVDIYSAWVRRPTCLWRWHGCPHDHHDQDEPVILRG